MVSWLFRFGRVCSFIQQSTSVQQYKSNFSHINWICLPRVVNPIDGWLSTITKSITLIIELSWAVLNYLSSVTNSFLVANIEKITSLIIIVGISLVWWENNTSMKYKGILSKDTIIERIQLYWTKELYIYYLTRHAGYFVNKETWENVSYKIGEIICRLLITNLILILRIWSFKFQSTY